MPRQVISAPSVRIAPKSVDLQKQLEQQAEERKERRAKLTETLNALMATIPHGTQRQIRMYVALSVPDKPMTVDQLQMWLDEKTLGVARYMMNGSIL